MIKKNWLGIKNILEDPVYSTKSVDKREQNTFHLSNPKTATVHKSISGQDYGMSPCLSSGQMKTQSLHSDHR